MVQSSRVCFRARAWGRQVGTKVTYNEGKGMRKTETFRTSQAEGDIFSRPSFSSVVEWHHLSVESDQLRAMIWLFRLCPFAFFSFQYFFWSAWFKGSVERSLPPWAIFLIFTRNRSWKSKDYLCTLFFIEMSKERLEKSERTRPVSWRPWALVYSPDRPYNFSCLSAVSKNRRFRSFSRLRVSFGKEKPFVNSNASF